MRIIPRRAIIRIGRNEGAKSGHGHFREVIVMTSWWAVGLCIYLECRDITVIGEIDILLTSRIWGRSSLFAN